MPPCYGSWLITQVEACNNAVTQTEDTLCLLCTPSVPYSHFIESALGTHQIHFQWAACISAVWSQEEKCRLLQRQKLGPAQLLAGSLGFQLSKKNVNSKPHKLTSRNDSCKSNWHPRPRPYTPPTFRLSITTLSQRLCSIYKVTPSKLSGCFNTSLYLNVTGAVVMMIEIVMARWAVRVYDLRCRTAGEGPDIWFHSKGGALISSIFNCLWLFEQIITNCLRKNWRIQPLDQPSLSKTKTNERLFFFKKADSLGSRSDAC